MYEPFLNFQSWKPFSAHYKWSISQKWIGAKNTESIRTKKQLMISQLLGSIISQILPYKLSFVEYLAIDHRSYVGWAGFNSRSYPNISFYLLNCQFTVLLKNLKDNLLSTYGKSTIVLLHTIWRFWLFYNFLLCLLFFAF